MKATKIMVLWLFVWGSVAQAQKITRAEYFIDRDLGPGKGTLIAGVTKADSIDIKNVNIPTSGLTDGSHILGVRTRDSLGMWSATYISSFSILAGNINSDTGKTKLVQAEYFFGKDPGPGKGTAFVVPKADSTWDVSKVEFPLPDTLGLGLDNYFSFRIKQSNGLWGAIQTFKFDVCSSVAVAPAASGATICGGTGTATLKATGASSKQYAWFTSSWDKTKLEKTSQAGSKTDTTYTTTTLSTNTDYWVANATTGACPYGLRTKVSVEVVAALSAPVVSNVARCGKGVITLVASGAPVGGSYRWYNTDTSKTWLKEGAVFQTDTLLATQSYVVSTISNGGKCESPTKKKPVATIKTCIDQTITFPTPQEMIFGFDTLQMLKASTSSGLKVKYELIGGPVRLQGDSVLPTSIGEVTIRATQSGNQDYNEAVKVTRKFRVVAGSSTLIIDYNQPLCTGSELKLIATAIKDGRYNWSGPNGFKSTTQSPSIYNVSFADSGNYMLTVYAPTDTFTTVQKVKVFPSPSKIGLYSVQQAKCEKEYQLFTQGDSISSYEWTFNAKKLLGFTDSTLKPSLSGGYSVLGFNKYGCSVGSIPVFVDVDPDSVPFLTRLRNPVRLKAPLAAHYQWFVDNYFIANSNVQELPLIYNGSYKVQLVNAKGCVSYSPEYEIFDDNLPSLRTEMLQNGQVVIDEFTGLSIVPQPAQDEANISWSSPKRGLVTMELVNASGQIASKTIASKENEVFMYRLATHDFTSGLYLLRLTCEDKQVTKQMLLSK